MKEWVAHRMKEIKGRSLRQVPSRRGSLFSNLIFQAYFSQGRARVSTLHYSKMAGIPETELKQEFQGEPMDAGMVAPDAPGYIKPQQRLLHDPMVSFEEYLYYARMTRDEEDEIDRNDPTRHKTRIRDILFPPKRGPGADGEIIQMPPGLNPEEQAKRRSSVNANLANKATRAVVTDDEWKNASRALRTATWAACFYLITTDILGPFGVGFSMGTLGWGPGIGLFTVFGLMAG